MSNPYIAKYAAMTEDEQFAAVCWGDKPMCDINTKHETSLPHIEVHGQLVAHLSSGKVSYPYISYLYYKRGHEAEARRAAFLLTKKKTKKEHKELGLLLGYTKKEVNDWVASL